MHLSTTPSKLISVAFVSVLLGSCAGFSFPDLTSGSPGGSAMPTPTPPRISVANVLLSESPTQEELASYFCAQHVPAPANLLVCRAFGPVRSQQDLRFAFDLEIDVENPNQIPLPLVQALIGFTAYPGANSQNLGALCTSFCEDPNNCAQNAADACQSDEPEIRDMRSFGEAAAGFLIRAATGQANLQDLRIRTIPAGETLRIVMRLQVDTLQMLSLIERAGHGALDQIRQGTQPQFAIPYSVEGTAWVSIEGLGRVAAGFGPTTGEWQIQ